MKHLVLILLFVSTIGDAVAQAPYIQWKKCYGGTDLDNGFSIAQLADSSYIIAGTSGSTDGDVTGNHGLYDFWAAKITSTGAITWQKSYGGSISDNCNFICTTSDGGYVLGGNSRSGDGDVATNNGGYDFWIVKIDSLGAIVWKRSYGSSGFDFMHCVREMPDGSIIAVGRCGGSDMDVTGNHGAEDIWVIKLTAGGTLVWKKCYGGTGDDDGGAVWPAFGGGYFVLGNTTSNDGDVTGNHGGNDLWLLKLSDTGGIVWQKCMGGTGDEMTVGDIGSGGLQQTSDSGIIVTGWSDSNDGDVTGNHGMEDFWVVKLTSAGSIVWQKSLGGTDNEEATSVQQTADTGFIIAGTTYSNDGDVSGNHGGFDYWLVKVSATGTLQWQMCMGGTGASPGDCANQVLATPGGGYIVMGGSNASDFDVTGNHGGYDYWVVRLNCTMPDAGVITGPSAVCKGSTITLADTATGGGWYAQNSNATVSGGVVTGINAGISIITYSKTNTCGGDFALHTVTVHPLPVPVISVAGSVLSTTTPFITYQWLSASGPIAGATNATYTVTASGTYRVIVTDANGCSDTSLAQTLVPAGIGMVSANQVSILPNPTTGMIFITGSERMTIKVYNAMGRLVKEAHAELISISECPAGLYFVRVFSEQGVLLHQEKIMLLRL